MTSPIGDDPLSDRRHGQKPIPVIDLFAGPGGLGEGFSSLRALDGSRLFQIRLSVEMDEHAHRTLELRAFYRRFDDADRPDGYYEYVRQPSPEGRAALFEAWPGQAAAASAEAWRHELSLESAETVKKRVARAIGRSKTWILIGGPPCQAYSLAGRSRRTHDEEFAEDPKHRLYQHYLRILDEHQPPFFVMENVKGMLSARLDGSSTIDKVLSDLRAAGEGYRIYSFVIPTDGGASLDPVDFVIKAEDFGIPQARHRVILFGVRRDVRATPEVLNMFEPQVRVGDVLDGLPRLRSRISHRGDGADTFGRWLEALGGTSERLQGVDIRTKAIARAAVADAAKHDVKTLDAGFRKGKFVPKSYAAWYRRDPRLAGVTNHEARSHMPSDIQRYLFCSSFSRANGRSPVLGEFPDELLPNHANAVAGALGIHFADRFRVQLRGRPSTTITSHISKDGHYYIHYDPRQARSLSVREAARLQTFPDDYFFEGNRTQQYHQVGNAVPPLLARQLAVVVARAIGREPEPALPE